jgi:hypothetical protein
MKFVVRSREECTRSFKILFGKLLLKRANEGR